MPECKRDDFTKWNNCVGTYTWVDGAKYVGEFKDWVSNGKVTLTFPSGDRHEGIWKNGALVE